MTKRKGSIGSSPRSSQRKAPVEIKAKSLSLNEEGTSSLLQQVFSSDGHHHSSPNPLYAPLLSSQATSNNNSEEDPLATMPPAYDDTVGRGLRHPLLRESSSAATDHSDRGSSTSLRQRVVSPEQTVPQHDDDDRILDRDAAFYQSRGRWNVQCLSRDAARQHHHHHSSAAATSPSAASSSSSSSPRTSQQGQRRRSISNRRRRQKQQGRLKRFYNDWFYTLAYQRTVVLMFILFLVYTAIVFVFAGIYYGFSKLGSSVTVNPDGSTSIITFCDMDIHVGMQALYFSLSTMTTIGYGVSDYYFGGCWTPLLLVLAQVCCAITFDAVAIGLLFQRISRGHKRGKTILFSNTAVIQRIQGQLYMMFRIGELRDHQLRDVSVRAYCIRHERHMKMVVTSSSHQQSATEALQQQQQQPGPLHQRRTRKQHIRNKSFTLDERTATAATSNTLIPSTAAAVDDSNAANAAPISSSTRRGRLETTHFVTRSVKLMHQEFNSQVLMSLPQMIVHVMDSKSPLQPNGSVWFDAHGNAHSSTTSAVLGQGGDTASANHGIEESSSHLNDDYNRREQQRKIQAFLADRQAEIVVLVEGTDELTGAAIQARHSYTHQDLAWNQTFVPCIFPNRDRGDTHSDVADTGAESSDDDDDNNNTEILVDEEALVRQAATAAANRRSGRGGSSRFPFLSRARHRRHPMCIVDFAVFHDTVMAPLDCESSPYVSS